MAAPKIRPSEFAKLFQEGDKQNLHDKKIIESLKERLNEKIQKDPETCKKAALIIEHWLKIRSKP